MGEATTTTSGIVTTSSCLASLSSAAITGIEKKIKKNTKVIFNIHLFIMSLLIDRELSI
jgi:hypothetical protein